MYSFLHNLDFYISLVKGIEVSTNYGFFPMYINPVANAGMGSFAPIATPHLLLYIPALIYHFLRDINLSFNIFFIVLNVFQFLFMYLALQEITKQKMRSIIGAILYVATYLIMLNTPFRLGLSEYIAVTFIPLVIYGFCNIYFNDSKYRIALLIGLFFIAESNVTIFIFTLIVVLAFCVIFFLKSIFRMKILRIIFTLIPLIILLAYTYVPMVHFYMLKQYSIVNVIGDMRIIITSFIVSIIPLIYILICKRIINKVNNEIIKTIINVVVLLLFTCSLYMYSLFFYTDTMTIKDNISGVDTIFIPKVSDEYYEKNNDYLSGLYKNCGTSTEDIKVGNFNQSYLFMNIKYTTSPNFERCVLDVPYYNVIGFKAYDKDSKLLPLTYGVSNECRVIVPKGSGLIKIGFRPLMMWNVALVVSVCGVFLLILWRIFCEIRTYKKLLKKDKKEKIEKEKEMKKEQEKQEKQEKRVVKRIKLALENKSDI